MPSSLREQLLAQARQGTGQPETAPASTGDGSLRQQLLRQARESRESGDGSASVLDTFKGLGTAISEGVSLVGSGLSLQQSELGSVMDGPGRANIDRSQIPQRQLQADQDIRDEQGTQAQADISASTQAIADARPEGLSSTQEGVRAGIESFAVQAPALVASLVTRNPTIALTSMAVMADARKYAEAREAGLDPSDAKGAALRESVIEVATEAVPTGRLLNLFGPALKDAAGKVTKASLRRRIAEFAVTEVAGEQVATFLQSYNDAMSGLDDEMAGLLEKGDYAKAAEIQLERQYITAIATVVGGGAQVAVARGVSRAAGADNKNKIFAAELERQLGQMEAAGFDAGAAQAQNFQDQGELDGMLSEQQGILQGIDDVEGQLRTTRDSPLTAEERSNLPVPREPGEPADDLRPGSIYVNSVGQAFDPSAPAPDLDATSQQAVEVNRRAAQEAQDAELRAARQRGAEEIRQRAARPGAPELIGSQPADAVVTPGGTAIPAGNPAMQQQADLEAAATRQQALVAEQEQIAEQEREQFANQRGLPNPNIDRSDFQVSTGGTAIPASQAGRQSAEESIRQRDAELQQIEARAKQLREEQREARQALAGRARERARNPEQRPAALPNPNIDRSDFRVAPDGTAIPADAAQREAGLQAQNESAQPAPARPAPGRQKSRTSKLQYKPATKKAQAARKGGAKLRGTMAVTAEDGTAQSLTMSDPSQGKRGKSAGNWEVSAPEGYEFADGASTYVADSLADAKQKFRDQGLRQSDSDPQFNIEINGRPIGNAAKPDNVSPEVFELGDSLFGGGKRNEVIRGQLWWTPITSTSDQRDIYFALQGLVDAGMDLQGLVDGGGLSQIGTFMGAGQFDPQVTNVAGFYTDKNRQIALSPRDISLAANGGSRYVHLVRTLAHELGHAFDRMHSAEGMSNGLRIGVELRQDGNGWDIIAPTLEIGKIYNELQGLYYSNNLTGIGRLMGYPLSSLRTSAQPGDKLARTVQREVFAQLHEAYYTTPDVLAEEAPLSFAWIERTLNENRNQPPAERQAASGTDTVRPSFSREQGRAEPEKQRGQGPTGSDPGAGGRQRDPAPGPRAGNSGRGGSVNEQESEPRSNTEGDSRPAQEALTRGDVVGERAGRARATTDALYAEAKRRLEEDNRALDLAKELHPGFQPSTTRKKDPSLQRNIARNFSLLRDAGAKDYQEGGLERSVFRQWSNLLGDEIGSATNYQELVQESYKALGEEVDRQFDAMTRAGFTVNWVSTYEEGYADSTEMLADALINRRLNVFQGGEKHPFLGAADKNGISQNDKFRAVHDYFGHATSGATFGPVGEENAWFNHAQMLSPLAMIAMSSETRGQNSWVNFSGKNKRALELFGVAALNRKQYRKTGDEGFLAEADKAAKAANELFEYAEQKAVALPPDQLKPAIENLEPEPAFGADGSRFFSKKALENHEGNNPKSRETIVLVSPEQFLSIAEKGFDQAKQDRVRGMIADGTKFGEMPYIEVTNEGDVAKAVGHDGRHRMRELSRMGVEQVPIRLKFLEGGSSPAVRWGDGNTPIPDTILGEDGSSTQPMPKSEIFPDTPLDDIDFKLDDPAPNRKPKKKPKKKPEVGVRPPKDGEILLPHGAVERGLDALMRRTGGNPSRLQLRRLLGAPKPRKGQERKLDINVKPTTLAEAQEMLDWAVENAGENLRWYDQFGTGIAEIVGEANMQEASVIFGVTSAQNSAEVNLADTLHIMRMAREISPITRRVEFITAIAHGKERENEGLPDRRVPRSGGNLKISRESMEKIADMYTNGTIVGGIKTTTYMQMVRDRSLNQFNPFSVMDVHMARVWGYRRMVQEVKDGETIITDGAAIPNDNAYRYSQYMTTVLAERNDMTPNQTQALLWFYAKSRLSPKDASAKPAKKRKAVGDGTWSSSRRYSEPEVQAIKRLVDAGKFDKNKALTTALRDGLKPSNKIKPGTRDDFSNLALNAELEIEKLRRSGRVQVSTRPGFARGYGWQGATLEQELDYHQDVIKALTTGGKVNLLEALRIPNRISTDTYGTFEGLEASVVVQVMSTMRDAKMVAPILGHALMQDAVVTWRPVSAAESQSAGVEVRKSDGTPFTVAEMQDITAAVNPSKSPDGLNFSTTEDLKGLRWIDDKSFGQGYTEEDRVAFANQLDGALGGQYKFKWFHQEGELYGLNGGAGTVVEAAGQQLGRGEGGRPDILRAAVDSVYQPAWEVYSRHSKDLGITPGKSPEQELRDAADELGIEFSIQDDGPAAPAGSQGSARPKPNYRDQRAILTAAEDAVVLGDGDQPPTSNPRSGNTPAEDYQFNLDDETRWDAIIRRFQDKFRRLKRVQAAIEKQTGSRLPDRSNPYQLEELFHGKSSRDAKLLEDEHVDPLAKEMQRLGVELEELDLFLYARHAKERNQHIANINSDKPDGGSGMTNAEADAILERARVDGQFADLAVLADRVYAMLQQTRDRMRSSGLIDQTEYDAYQDSYKYYVPLKGIAEDEGLSQRRHRSLGGRLRDWVSNTRDPERPGLRTGQGFSVRGKESIRAIGRRTMAESPTMHAIMDGTEKIIRARKNEVAQGFLRLVEQYPDPSIWEAYTTENPPTRRAFNPKTRKVEDTPIDLANAKDEDGNPKYFAVKQGGKSTYIRIRDERLHRAMANLGVENLGEVSEFAVNTIGAATRFLSSVNTTLNPEFFVTNAARDLQTAVFNMLAEQDLPDGKAKGKDLVKRMVQDWPAARRAVARGLAGKPIDGEYGQFFEEFQSAGAMTGWTTQRTLTQEMRRLESLRWETRPGASATIRSNLKKTLDVVENINLAFENAVRLSAYANARRSGLSVDKSASLAKNLTVNFNRRGENSTVANSFFMFFNAAIQGNYQFVRSVVSNPKTSGGLTRAQQAAGAMAAMGVLQAIWNEMIGGDDDDEESHYSKVPDYIKERNMVLFYGEGADSYVKVPLPYGYNVFHVLGASMGEASAGSKSAAWAGVQMLRTITGSFSPLGLSADDDGLQTAVKAVTPSVALPFMEIAMNSNHFGEPVYRENFPTGTQKPDSSMHKRSTSQAAVAVAQWLNDVTGGAAYVDGMIDISPDSMEHLIGFSTGGLGRFTGRLYRGTETALTDPAELSLRDAPFSRLLIGKASPWEDAARYYDRIYEVRQTVSQRDSLRGKERMQWVKDNRDALALEPLIQASEKSLRGIRKRRREYEKVVQDPARLQELTDRLEEEEGRVYDRFNRRWNRTNNP